MGTPEPAIYEFDDFHVDAVERVLLRNGASVPLTPRVFDTLLCFVRHYGKVLEKDELMRTIWPDAVVEENNLNQNVSALRRTIGTTCIVTVPGRGYRFAAAVRSRTARGAIPIVAPGKTIAVLPFVNMSAESENEYFCDGLAEELINALTKIEGLRVVARTSAFSFKGKNASISEIRDALGAGRIWKAASEGRALTCGSRCS